MFPDQAAAYFLLFFAADHKDYRPVMNRIVIVLALAAAATGRADLVLQQQITTANYQGVTTMKIKGTRMRLDLYAGQPKAQSIITDLNTGEIITLLHGEKLYLKTAGGPTKQNRAAGAASAAPVPRPTGKTQKVGDYDTELYTWSNPRGITGTAWVARNFPDYARIQADIATLDRTSGADNGSTPELSSLPGMVVRSQVVGGGETITMALISARETPLDPGQFAIPRDYRELPKLKPVKPVAAQSTPPAARTNSKPSTSPQPSGSAKSSGNAKTPPGNYTAPTAPAW